MSCCSNWPGGTDKSHRKREVAERDWFGFVDSCVLRLIAHCERRYWFTRVHRHYITTIPITRKLITSTCHSSVCQAHTSVTFIVWSCGLYRLYLYHSSWSSPLLLWRALPHRPLSSSSFTPILTWKPLTISNWGVCTPPFMDISHNLPSQPAKIEDTVISLNQPVKLAISSFLLTCCVTAPLLQIKPVNHSLCLSSLCTHS